jgi:uncharacterized protein YndB with AHSA1/START domain
MAQLEREILIDADPETIYTLLTDAVEHRRWMGTEVELDPRPGGVYRVVVAGQYESGGEFVEVVPHEKVVFTFGWAAPDNPIRPGSTTVEYTLHPEGDKTLVRVRHSGLPDDAVGDHTHGWDRYLERLSIAAPGGDPGPDVLPAEPT